MNIQIDGQIEGNMDGQVKVLIDRLEMEKTLTKAEFVRLIEGLTPVVSEYLQEKARRIATAHFGNRVYTRGLIEFTNFCLNDCHYCGIRRSNMEASRYRLTTEEILSCCETGYQLGFRTFVLQGGEDPYFSDDRMVEIISRIRKGYPDCAITLSIGEKDTESYAR
ncbi:MAG TPA: radical SAM protein, partial [Clostridiaceae bacterium]|nr:radical SAM protein [Clostridiaceae bacterium]